MTKNSKRRPFVRVAFIAFLVSLLLFFTSLDNKIFDIFTRLLPPLTESGKVFVLTLDDDSINYAGGFPFPREVMADVVILLKELGVQTIAFDLSYLDASPQRLDPDYASVVFSRYLESGFGRIDEASAQVIEGINPRAGAEERELFKTELLALNRQVREELETSLAFLTRDVDEYFAEALAFSNVSLLTLTMIGRQDLLTDSGEELKQDEETSRYLEENIALKSITAGADHKTPDMAGVMPAIQKLLSRAKGAGFVNADPDPDGLLRRINLLVKYRDNYYGHLALMALLEGLGNPRVEVNNTNVILKNAVLNGGARDLRIPRAEDGSLLIKWPKKSFYAYKNIMSLIELIQHTMIEPVLAENIALMDESGFFSFWDGGANPWELYAAAERVKQDMMAAGASASPRSPEEDSGEAAASSGHAEWLAARKAFFAACNQFVYNGYEETILEAVSGDEETAEYVRELFANVRAQTGRLAEIRSAAAVLENSVCVIGADATSMTDFGITPYEKNFPNVGTYGVAANMILAGEFLDDAPVYVSIIIALVFSLILGFMVSRFDTGKSIATGIIGILFLTGSFAAFFALTRIYIGFAVPLISSGITLVSLMVIKFLSASREKTFLHGAFSRYLAPSVINEIIDDPSKLNLGGEKREMTALFTDIEGFSGISEELQDPTKLVTLLNLYLTAMSTIIMENLGTIDKYEGDAIIAFFGAPIHHEDHAIHACRSALAIKKAEAELNRPIMRENMSPRPLFTRVGINTGEMVVGNMGAENKMDYTVMGNSVNLASRLEGINKQYRTGGILISEYTKTKIGDEFLCRALDRVRVVGVNTPLRLYELAGLKSDADSKELDRIAGWENAMALLEQRKFVEAKKLFLFLAESNKDDRTAILYAERCENYLNAPPGDDWDGVYNLTEK